MRILLPISPYFTRVWCTNGMMVLLYDWKPPHKLLFSLVHGWN